MNVPVRSRNEPNTHKIVRSSYEPNTHRIVRSSYERSSGSSEFPNQILSQSGLGVPELCLDVQTNYYFIDLNGLTFFVPGA